MNYLKKVIINKDSKRLLRKSAFHDVYESETDNSKFTIFHYHDNKIGKNAIEVLKKFKHPNILQIAKCKLEKGNTYVKTGFIINIMEFYEKSYLYMHYVLYSLAEVIEFMSKCDIVHNDIKLENLYCKMDGKLVLTGFEHAKKEASNDDELMFLDLVKRVKDDIEFGIFTYDKKVTKGLYNTNPRIDKIHNEKSNNIDLLECDNQEVFETLSEISYTSVKHFLDKNKLICKKNIYFKIEVVFLKFKLLTIHEKQEFINFIVQNENSWILPVKEYFVNIYINEIIPEKSDYNDTILTMILQMNLPNYNIYMEALFELPISQVRMFLLLNYDKYKDKVSNWNAKISKNLIDTIRCSDENLQIESIRFLTKIHSKLESKKLKEVLKSLETVTKNENIWEEALIFANKICKNIESDDSLGREMYRFLVIYLNYACIRNQVLVLVYKIYKHIDIIKVQNELLPTLCSYLSDQNNQEICFDLIEDILGYLRKNKEQLIKGEWCVEKVSNVFKKTFMKTLGMNKKETAKKDQIEKTEDVSKNNNNDWDENW